MKLLFSEYKSDYSNYIFPYVIWAFPDDSEHPADIFERGFLPSTRDLSRYYMCRHTRVHLPQFEPSSENRRILRKGQGVSYRLLLRDEFHFDETWRTFCKSYADEKFGQDVMTYERLDSLFRSPVCSHLLVYTDDDTGRDIGLVVLYLNAPRMGFYYYSFYDLNHANKSLGMFMMTSSVALLKELDYAHIYLGSCYSRSALYKSQFSGFEFWNGFRWSDNISELKYLIERDGGEVKKHVLETAYFMQEFYPEGYET